VSRPRARQGSREHFIDPRRLLGEPTAAEDDPLGERFCFERGAENVGGGDGWPGDHQKAPVPISSGW
jgi:hypothetical protein